MPIYTYRCKNCNHLFEIVSSISKYKEDHDCSRCGSSAHRSYDEDMPTIFSSVKKHDTELKTIGDLAKRNTERMSEDEKTHLYIKHNSYKENKPEKDLPKGMSRIKKPKKSKWS